MGYNQFCENMILLKVSKAIVESNGSPIIMMRMLSIQPIHSVVSCFF